MLEFIILNVSFIIRMLVIFTLMMKYYHWREGKLTWVEKIPYAIFYVVDILYNWFSTIYFLDLPAKWDETITYRCKRYVKIELTTNPITWLRYYFAKTIQYITNLSDPGHV